MDTTEMRSWLGSTRSAARRDHRLQTPDTYVRTALPELRGGEVIVHASPAGGAGFAQYTAEIGPAGELRGGGWERFCYVLEGFVVLDAGERQWELRAGGYAFVPEGVEHRLHSGQGARLAVIERRAVPATAGIGAPDLVLVGREEEVAEMALGGDPAVTVRALLPTDDAMDLAVNVMQYEPGASLSQVEIHVMEHGLLMLQGAGIYRLGECWYPVAAGDFIWMGPFCPQWFGALGKTAARYLIYKDANRHPLAGEVQC